MCGDSLRGVGASQAVDPSGNGHFSGHVPDDDAELSFRQNLDPVDLDGLALGNLDPEKQVLI